MTTQTLDIRSEIRNADDVFEKVFSLGDASGLAELYTEQAMVFPTGSDIVKGKDAIRNFWKGAMDMGIKEAKLDILEIEQHGDVAIEVGQYQLKGAGGVIMDRGKYVVAWKQESGQWKLHRDIWNTNQSPQSS
jgi:uncharacterized protein (TIGR02246 family)